MKKLPSHGGNYNFYNKKISYDFSININPLNISELIKQKVLDSICLLDKYPEIYGESLVKKLSELYSCSPNNFIVGNGSIQLIYILPIALKIKNPIIVVPNFSEYEKSLNLYACNVDYYYLKEKNNFILDVTKFIDFLNKNNTYDAIFITNPSNPCGVLIEFEKIKELVKFCKKNNKYLIVDEAFIEFTEDPGLINLNFKKLIILRSFTKIFSIPGLRLGFIKSDKETIVRLKKYLPPWSLNLFSIEIGKFLIENYYSILKETKEFLDKERNFLKNSLNKLSNIKIFPSKANYFLIKLLNTMDVYELTECLLDNEILIRNCANYRGLNKKFFRIAIKERKENIILVNSLKEILLKK